jgi:hypothetical protein
LAPAAVASLLVVEERPAASMEYLAVLASSPVESELRRVGSARRAALVRHQAGSVPHPVAMALSPAELAQQAAPAWQRAVPPAVAVPSLPLVAVAALPVRWPTGRATGHRKTTLLLCAA